MADASTAQWPFSFILNTYNTVNSSFSAITGTSDPLKEVKCLDGSCIDKSAVTSSSYTAVTGKTSLPYNSHASSTLLYRNDAEEYCNRLNKHLPNADEWEKFVGYIEFQNPYPYGMHGVNRDVWEWVKEGSIHKDSLSGAFHLSYTRVANFNTYYDSLDFRVTGYMFRCITP